MPEKATQRPASPGRELNAAEELKRLNGVFLTGLNHEIRTPLSGILGMTDLLLETTLNDEQRDYVQSIRLCAETLLETLNATLEYSALASGGVRLEEVEFDVAETLEGATAPAFARAASQGISTRVVTEPGFPQTLVGDPLRLRQLLGHLLAAVLKHSSSGDLEVRLAEVSPGWVDVSLSATGFTVDRSVVADFLESFRSGNNDAQLGYAGLRLSLAVSVKLAELLDATLQIEPAQKTGVVFRVRLPMVRPEFELPAPAADELRAVFQILVVEDNPIGQRVLRHMLRQSQYLITFAETGRGAIEAARRQRFDLILMDLHMPDMSGLDATEAIRAIDGYAQVPVLALTADASDQYRELSREHGLQAYLTKPIQAAELHAAMARFLTLPASAA
jgi:CheY-like chemotaxis protein